VRTTWQQRRRKLAWIAGLLAAVIAVPVFFRSILDKGLGNLFNREAES